jgi:hypothetical protein
MNLEREIRDALHREAGGSSQQPPWNAVRARAAGRRRRRRTVGYPIAGFIAIVAIVAVVVGLALLRDDDSAPRNVTAGPAGTRPEQIAAIVDGKVVVLSSEDGSVVRTLAEGGEAEGPSSVAVSADGTTVYFTRADPDALCEQGAASQIVSVPIDGGPITIVASGQDPVVSPDGRYLAYATGGPDQCGAGLLAVRELRTDRFAQDLFPVGDAPPAPLDWSPDSSRILYGFVPPPTYEIREVDLEAIRRLAPARTVPLPYPANEATYLGASDMLAVVAGSEPDRRLVEAVEVPTGTARRLFELPIGPIVELHADDTGRHVLAVAVPSGPDPRPSLFGWSQGEEPELVLSGVRDADWVPAGRRPPPRTIDTEPAPESTSALPEPIVAATAGRLVELSPTDGRVVRPLGSGAPITSLEIAPDGTVYYSQDPGNCPGSIYSGELGRLHRDREPLFFEFVAEHGRWPAVSPDGRRLAYVTVADCGQLASLAIRDLATGEERLVRVPPVDADGRPLELVGPLVWDADSRHLIVPVRGDAGIQHQYLDVENATDVFEGGNIPRFDERDGPLAFASLGEAGRFAVMVADPDDEAALRVVEMDVPAGEIRRVLFGVSRLVIPALSSDGSGRHLLFVTREGALYRWSEGEEEPTKVADGIDAADW